MESKKKVAHVIYNLATAGAQTVVMNYMRSMQNDVDYEMYIVVGNSYSGLQYEEEALRKGYKVVYANYKPVLSNTFRLIRPIINWFRYQISLYKTLKIVNPDIIHTHLTLILPFVSIPILLLRKKRVHTLHSDPYAIPMRFFLFAMIVFHLFGFKVIGVTEKQADKAKKRYHLKNVPVVHNGLNLEKYKVEESKSDIRREFNIDANDFVIGTVGRFDKVKNHPFLIKVFAETLRKIPNAKLLLVGDGVERKNIEALVENLNLKKNVIFAGLREDVERMYHAMDVFAITSFFESSSIVTVEAQASGVRCVISSSIPDNVIVSDNVSCLSLNASIDDWVTAIIGNYPKNSRTNEIKLFSMDRTICELKNVYSKISL